MGHHAPILMCLGLILLALRTSEAYRFLTLRPFHTSFNALSITDSISRHKYPAYLSMCASSDNEGTSSDGEDGSDQMEATDQIEDVSLDGFKGALIADAGDRPTWEEFKSMHKEVESKNDGKSRALEYNWKYGFCKHYVTFEGSDTIRRLRFLGDLLAFGTISGQVAMIRISTGEVLDRFKEHNCEVTAIDFDGINLISGSSDGSLVIYQLTYGDEGAPVSVSSDNIDTTTGATPALRTNSKTNDSGTDADAVLDMTAVKEIREGTDETNTTTDFEALLGADENVVDSSSDIDPSVDTIGDVKTSTDNFDRGITSNSMGQTLKHFKSLHTRSVTSTKLLHLPPSKQTPNGRTLLISCSMDRKLSCIDMHTHEVLYLLDLPIQPLCMDVISSMETGNAYFVVGTIDGRISIHTAKSGKKLIEFEAHDRVRSVHFVSESIIVSGGNNGVIKRWDLEAEDGTERTSPKKRTKKQGNKADAQGVESTKSQKIEDVKLGGRFIDFYFQDAIKVGPSFSLEDTGFNSVGNRKGLSNSKISNRLTKSPTVEKAASAIRNKSDSEDSDEDNFEKDDVAVSKVKSTAKKMGSIMRERKRTYHDESQTSPVVSVQADDTKIVAAYEDGTLKSWGVDSMVSLFDLKGRTNLIANCQFDATRLIADGTHHILVIHDFGDADVDNSDDELRIKNINGKNIDGV